MEAYNQKTEQPGVALEIIFESLYLYNPLCILSGEADYETRHE